MYNLRDKNREIDITQRTFTFGVRIVRLSTTIQKRTRNFVIANQILRSGTSIGANVEEAQNCSSKKEFIRTLTIALKEGRETLYWLKLIVESKIIEKEKLDSLIEENIALIKILTSIIKKAKG